MRLPTGIRAADNDLQSLCALGATRGLGAALPRTRRSRSIDTDADDRCHPCESAPLGLGRKKREQSQAIGRSRGARNTKKPLSSRRASGTESLGASRALDLAAVPLCFNRNAGHFRIIKLLTSSGLISAQPQRDRGKLDEGEAVRRQLVIVSCDLTARLDLVEEPFDQVASTAVVGCVARREIKSS